MEGKWKVMDIQQLGILKIIEAAINNTKHELPDGFNFVNAVEIAKKHKIISLVYYGALNCGIPNDDPLMQELFMDTCKSMFIAEQQSYAVKEIFEIFDKNSIDYMPLKGTLLKELYPKPDMRLMGDADILIYTDQYDRIKPIMQQLNYQEILESDHEFVWRKAQVCIELHKRLIPSYNKDYYKYFGDGWRLATVNDGCCHYMTDEDQMIYLFTHFAKHYRDSGIGIRHIVDLWVYRNTKKLNEEYIKFELNKLQLLDFYKNILSTLDVWFNGKENNAITEFITQIIFNSGVYGTRESHLLSKALKEAKMDGSSKNVRSKRLVSGIFLPFKNMCIIYPFLVKAPILLPLMWFVRIFNIIFFKSDRITTRSQEYNIISSEHIDDYEKSLNFVGLDFDFKE